LLGQLSDLGYGPDRVVTLALHVDYFNDPWKDPFSDAQFSRREAEYSRIYHGINKDTKPDVLYFTPLMMVDGRFPLLGSGPESKAKLRAALDQSLREKPEVSLKLSLKDAGAGPDRKALEVTVRARSSKVAERKLLIGAAIYEDLVLTKVEAGELAGKTYVNHNVVRKFAVQFARPLARSTTLSFPLELAKGWDPEKCGLTVFAQDEQSGRIYQAATLRWKDRAVNDP
jgi:hypothetical protein